VKAEANPPGVDDRLARIVGAQPDVGNLQRDQAGTVEGDAGLPDRGVHIDPDQRGQRVLRRLPKLFAAELRGAEKVQRNEKQDGQDNDDADTGRQPHEKAAQPK